VPARNVELCSSVTASSLQHYSLLSFATCCTDYLGVLTLSRCSVLFLMPDRAVEQIREEPSHRVQSLLRFECPSLDEAHKWHASLTDSIAQATS